MKNIKQIFLLIFLATVFSTCKKYPEGPFISFKTREHRVAGTWSVEKYFVNGVDSTASKYPPGCTISFFAKASIGGHRSVYTRCEKSNGFWDFNKDCESIMVWQNSPIVKSSFFLEVVGKTEWKILKLRYKEMHLQTEVNSNRYEMYLNRVE